MSEIFQPSVINQAICSLVPGMTVDNVFLTTARILGNVYLGYRKITLAAENPISFGLGSGLALAVGDNPTIQQVARAILGSLSVIRCAEDLSKLRELRLRCTKIFDGRYYIPIRGDRFNIKGAKATDSAQWLDQFHYSNRMRYEKARALMETIGKMIDVFCDLMLHLGDIYIAYNEECLTEVFIHGRDLWDKLTSDQSYLYQQLETSESVNKFLFGSHQSWTLNILQQIVKAAMAVSKTATELKKDITKGVHKTVGAVGDAMDELDTTFKTVVTGLPRELHFDGKALVITKEEYERTRLIKNIKRVRVY